MARRADHGAEGRGAGPLPRQRHLSVATGGRPAGPSARRRWRGGPAGRVGARGPARVRVGAGDRLGYRDGGGVCLPCRCRRRGSHRLRRDGRRGLSRRRARAVSSQRPRRQHSSRPCPGGGRRQRRLDGLRRGGACGGSVTCAVPGPAVAQGACGGAVSCGSTGPARERGCRWCDLGRGWTACGASARVRGQRLLRRRGAPGDPCLGGLRCRRPCNSGLSLRRRHRQVPGRIAMSPAARATRSPRRQRPGHPRLARLLNLLHALVADAARHVGRGHDSRRLDGQASGQEPAHGTRRPRAVALAPTAGVTPPAPIVGSPPAADAPAPP